MPIGLGEGKRFVWMGLRREKKLAKRVTENRSIAETLSKAREVILFLESSVTGSWRGEDGQRGILFRAKTPSWRRAGTVEIVAPSFQGRVW